MYKSFWAILALASLSFSSHGQQRIYGEFSAPVFVEDFYQSKGSFPTITTVENYYTVDDSTYFMNRNNPVSPFAVMANFPNELNAFHLSTNLKLGPSETKEQTVGLIFMSQRDSNSAYVFEFNRNKRYRIRRIRNGIITSMGESIDGWVKSNALMGIDEYNKLEVKTTNGDFDFYINGSFVTSFYDNTFENGNMGFFIGPMTKARAEYFHVFTTEPSIEDVQKSENEMRIEQLEKENAALKAELSESLDAKIVELQGVIQVLETQLVTTNRDNEVLRQEIEQYEEIRFLVGNIDKELILTLSRNLREEILKNQALTNENVQLKDSIDILSEEMAEFKMNVLDKIVDGTYLIDETGNRAVNPEAGEGPKQNKETSPNGTPEKSGQTELPKRKAKKRD